MFVCMPFLSLGVHVQIINAIIKSSKFSGLRCFYLKNLVIDVSI